jgi:Amt family ammonium transporter
MQIFATHAIGGVVGNILTGIFAQKSIASFDGSTQIQGGWMDHHWPQVGFQLANSVAGISYSFVMTVRNLDHVPNTTKSTHSLHQTIILWAMHLVPTLRLRCSEETEIVGMDDAEMGEFAYDYVSVALDISPRRMYGDDASSIGSMRQRRDANPSLDLAHQRDAEVQNTHSHLPISAI